MEEKYMKISELASLFNTTTDAIRFYEKRGILHPVRNENNAYRGYTQEDITHLYDCKHFQNVGFSLSEIAAIINDTAPEAFDALLEQKAAEIERELVHYQRILDQMHRLQSAQHLYDYYKGRFYIRNSPHLLFCPYAKHGSLNQDSLSKPFYRDVIEYHNMFRRCLLIPQESLVRSAEFSDLQGYSIEIEKAAELGIEKNEYIDELMPRRSVYTVLKVASRPAEADLRPITDWICTHGFTICGDAVVWTLKITYDHGVPSRLYSVWVPIE